MPSFKGKDGSMKFSMNPQAGAAMYGGSDPAMDPNADPNVDPSAGADDTHVELHHGGNPQGQPPPTPTTKYHTIATSTMDMQPDIRNHDDYQSADQHMQECMGATDDGMDDAGDMGDSSTDLGGDMDTQA